MPCDLSQYRPDWKAFAFALKESVGWLCEGCGAPHAKRHPQTGSVVVLTVAHLNHQPRDDRRENLRVWCQCCHNRHDARHRAVNAIHTRAAKRGQMMMPFKGDNAAPDATAASVNPEPLICPKCGCHLDEHLPPWLVCPAPAPAAALPLAMHDRDSTPCLHHER